VSIAATAGRLFPVCFHPDRFPLENFQRQRGSLFQLVNNVPYKDSSGLKQRMIAERFGVLDASVVSRDRRAIWEKIETEPKIRKWFQDLTGLST
jgi:hypothetical protein